jgi:hypothetical protein
MLTSARPLDWAVFAGSVLVAMALGRLLFGRPGEHIQFREALARSLLWITLGLAFGGYVYVSLGHQDAVDYLVAYLVEESLSVDNLSWWCSATSRRMTDSSSGCSPGALSARWSCAVSSS